MGRPRIAAVGRLALAADRSRPEKPAADKALAVGWPERTAESRITDEAAGWRKGASWWTRPQNGSESAPVDEAAGKLRGRRRGSCGPVAAGCRQEPLEQDDSAVDGVTWTVAVRGDGRTAARRHRETVSPTAQTRPLDGCVPLQQKRPRDRRVGASRCTTPKNDRNAAAVSKDAGLPLPEAAMGSMPSTRSMLLLLLKCLPLQLLLLQLRLLLAAGCCWLPSGSCWLLLLPTAAGSRLPVVGCRLLAAA